MILESDNIRFRSFRLDDVSKLVKWKSDPELRLLAMFNPYPVSYENETNWLNSIINDKSNSIVTFAAETIVDKVIIGYFQLRQIDLVSRTAFLSIIIGDKDMRGKGFGQEMLNLGISYGKATLKLHKVSLEVLSSNQRAIKLYEKSGFVSEGLFKSHFFGNGSYHDVIRMAYFYK